MFSFSKLVTVEVVSQFFRLQYRASFKLDVICVILYIYIYIYWGNLILHSPWCLPGLMLRLRRGALVKNNILANLMQTLLYVLIKLIGEVYFCFYILKMFFLKIIFFMFFTLNYFLLLFWDYFNELISKIIF
jgi:hypothetical protein